MRDEKIKEERMELIGLEFDWFAIDKDGSFGLFSSAGFGAIPRGVIKDNQNHKKISEQFVLPNYGSELIWNDLAKYGFYIFDYQNGSYKKLSNPKSSISTEIRKLLLELESIEKMKVSFSTASEVIVDGF